jgi:hypothetical protein
MQDRPLPKDQENDIEGSPVMTRTRMIAYLTVIALVATVAFTATLIRPVQASDASPGAHWHNDLDAASSALPTAAQPTVNDQTADLLRTGQGGAKATAVSTASSSCDGCRAQATTLQVVYFDGAGANNADNVASAWSQCSSCSSSAISVQVVVARSSDQLTVNNRSLAVNVLCTDCTTNSIALQYVLLGGSRHDLSAAAKDLVTQLQSTLADRLDAATTSTAADPQARATADTDSIAEQLQQILVADTGSTSAQRNIDVQIGA